MLISGFPSGSFQANCYVVASEPGADAVIVDPGQGALPGIRAIIAEHKVKPVAVFATHGHFDHIFSAREVCDEFSIPLYIHPDDRPLLSNPLHLMDPSFAMNPLLSGVTFIEPEKVIDFIDGETVDVAGVRFAIDHAPGHSPGSVTIRFEAQDQPGGAATVCFSGDVLFNGAIGRTDLGGGSREVLLASIAHKLLVLNDDVVVLPGHGPATTIGAERASNPFLVGL